MDSAIWRDPPEESVDLYPGLVVHDGRVSGSITTGKSRLPLWAFVGTAVSNGWGEVENGWHPGQYGWTDREMAVFLGNLLEQRGEFARLICVLADVERRRGPWWERKGSRRRVLKALKRCVEGLERQEALSGQEGSA